MFALTTLKGASNLRFVLWAEPPLGLAGLLLPPPPWKTLCIPFFFPSSSFPLLYLPWVLEHSGAPELGPPYLLCVFSPSARNVRPKMTIYVCQELEQSRAPLQQKRDGSGDNSLCGEP